jgi:hypothetical protein
MTKRVQLGKLALARSGDKGPDANVGVWAEDEPTYEFLVGYLTEERVADHFRALGMSRVERYELPNLKALNFVLVDALDGGGTVSLRTDAQGKTLSLGLLQMVVDAPDELVR